MDFPYHICMFSYAVCKVSPCEKLPHCTVNTQFCTKVCKVIKNNVQSIPVDFEGYLHKKCYDYHNGTKLNVERRVQNALCQFTVAELPSAKPPPIDLSQVWKKNW